MSMGVFIQENGEFMEYKVFEPTDYGHLVDVLLCAVDRLEQSPQALAVVYQAVNCDLPSDVQASCRIAAETFWFSRHGRGVFVQRQNLDAVTLCTALCGLVVENP